MLYFYLLFVVPSPLRYGSGVHYNSRPLADFRLTARSTRPLAKVYRKAPRTETKRGAHRLRWPAPGCSLPAAAPLLSTLLAAILNLIISQRPGH